MAIAEITGQRNTQGGGASTSVSFVYPASTTDGNLVVATFSYRLSGTTITVTPTGWTNIERREGNINTVISYGVVGSGGLSAGTTYTWTISDSVKSAGTAMEYTGNGWTSPFDKSQVNSGATGTTGLSTNATATTTGTAELIAIAAHGCDTNATWSVHFGTNVTATEISEISSTGGPTTSRNTCSTSTGIFSANEAVSVEADLSASNNWAAVIAVFKEDTAAAYSPRRLALLGVG